MNLPSTPLAVSISADAKGGRFSHILRVVARAGRTLVRLILSLLALLSVCFLIMHIVPGDPFQDEQGVPKEVLENIRHKYGLDQPIYIQYISYLGRLLHGDLGTSMRYPSQPITKIIGNAFPISLHLGLQAMAIAVPIGILLGALSAYRVNSKSDFALTIFSTLGISIPNFVIAALLQLIFSLYLHLFPVARWESFAHTILPSFALSVGPICGITRMMRAGMLDALSKEWVITARMKGLAEWRIILLHVIPNALLPVLHYLGPTTANVLTGSFVIERVFCIPGLGQWFVQGVMSRDYPLIAGLTLFYSIILYVVHAFIERLSSLCNARLSHYEDAR